jgi:uncharacterized protein (DUF1330 family)
VTDPVGYKEYRNLAGASLEKYGGKCSSGAAPSKFWRGDWKPKRIVVLEFASMPQAKERLNCEEYREARNVRHRTARTNMVLVDGV